MFNLSKIQLGVFFIIVFAACHYNKVPQKVPVTKENESSDLVIKGKKLFEATCVRCHGMDGSGLTGPSLKRAKLTHAPDLPRFTTVVQQGIAGTGMPANWAYTDEDCKQLYAYINKLKNLGNEIPSGDSDQGKKVYANNGCRNCHLMKGEGISIGPDLSKIGISRNLAYLKQALLDPTATLPESLDIDNGYGFSLYLPVKVVTSEGIEINALRINEDTYTIQLKDIQNNYYSFNKDQLKSIEKNYGHSLMPSYKNILTNKEVENLVAFLYKSGNQ